MSLSFRILNDLNELKKVASSWDALWESAFPCLPTVRAEGIANWTETFSAADQFRAAIVQRGSAFVAAVPLVRRNFAHCLPAFVLPGNEWSSSADLLLDQAAGSEVVELLVEGLARERFSLLALNDIPLNAPQWQSFTAAVAKATWTWRVRSLRDVGVVEIQPTGISISHPGLVIIGAQYGGPGRSWNPSITSRSSVFETPVSQN